MSFWSGPPNLKPTFSGGGVKNVEKMTSPFFVSEIMNLFFYFEPKKCCRVLTPWGLYGAEWDERLCSLCSC